MRGIEIRVQRGAGMRMMQEMLWPQPVKGETRVKRQAEPPHGAVQRRPAWRE